MNATIIEAPTSTKKQSSERDPDMRQTKKGNQWHFGMKAHIGVDAHPEITHSFTTSALYPAIMSIGFTLIDI